MGDNSIIYITIEVPPSFLVPAPWPGGLRFADRAAAPNQKPAAVPEAKRKNTLFADDENLLLHFADCVYHRLSMCLIRVSHNSHYRNVITKPSMISHQMPPNPPIVDRVVIDCNSVVESELYLIASRAWPGSVMAPGLMYPAEIPQPPRPTPLPPYNPLIRYT